MDLIVEISKYFHENFFIIWTIALFLGSWTLFTEIYRFVHFIYVKLIRKRKNLKERYSEGKWALITGSSEGKYYFYQGIGKAFALGLAK
jgi:hypothetical protein